MTDSRYIVGVDLGTTNIAVAYIDTEKTPDTITVFPVPQLIAPGEIGENPLLPACCFIPAVKQVQPGSLNLPWNKKLDYAIGVYAREEGPSTPKRFISSAKSWLCHAGVNRREKILPWGQDKAAYSISPLEVTTRYLDHLKQSWNHKFKRRRDRDGNRCTLETQQVVVTVPASFDETARELTLEAARNAGFKNLTLQEEPLAAFYAWLDQNRNNWKQEIPESGAALVIDVGGGTSDFSLIELDSEGVLNRTATGEHLLLGGDNIDIALAKKIESEWNTHLPPGEWASLCQQTRKAKELILGGNADSADVTLLGSGSSVIGGARKSQVRKKELAKLLDEGFFPEIPADSTSPERRGGIRAMGLPYAADPALPRHLLAFLRYAAKLKDETGSGILCPDRVLFNGGAMIPDSIRNRILKIIESWFPGKDISELESAGLNLAVARGAAVYGRTRRGDGIKVKSGAARSYYLQIEGNKPDNHLCVMPRGVEENRKQAINRGFVLEANRKVSFPLFSSATRIKDKTGDFVPDSDELTPVKNLISVIKFGKSGARSIHAGITAELTESGLLQVCLESKDTNHVWPLHFDTRELAESQPKEEEKAVQVVDAAKIGEAAKLIEKLFLKEPANLPSIAKSLEKTLGLPRQEWPLPLLRELADALLKLPGKMLKTPQQENRWLNLTGFCLRPGFGDPADRLRLQKIWKHWFSGLKNPNNAQTAAEWWVFWRRVAPGLATGHQRTIFQVLAKQLFPKDKLLKQHKLGAQVHMEMWRCIGSLELLQPDRKTAIGELLTASLNKLREFEFWVIGRLAARHLFHASAENLVPSGTATRWAEKLLTMKKPDRQCLFALSRIAAVTSDRHLDITPAMKSKIRKTLTLHNAPEAWLKHLDGITADTGDEQKQILGDSLPLGLKLAE